LELRSSARPVSTAVAARAEVLLRPRRLSPAAVVIKRT
jgi:hypothetical protein